MKTTLIASVALATVIASPVLAQTTVRRAPAQQNVQQLNRALTPNDIQSPNEIQSRSLDPNAVYQGNQYLGSDPDPNVRLLLRLDAEHRD